MEGVENVVIVGAGIAGLATALGLHRMGIKSLVLESADHLRTTGFSIGIWANAWRALDELGIGDNLRDNHVKLQELITTSTSNGSITKVELGNKQLRSVKRIHLLEGLASELPRDSIRFGAKVVSIEEFGDLKLLHFVDGSTLKTKVLIGCDGVNSIVAKWLGLGKPLYSGRCAVRGMAEYPSGHGFGAIGRQYIGDGFRCGFVPCDEKNAYWFLIYWLPSSKDEVLEQNPLKVKEFVVRKIEKIAPNMVDNVERTDLSNIVNSHLRFRNPLDMLWGHVYKGNVCLAGDAFHAMTPDIGQGGCAALEDSIVLARCLGNVLLNDSNVEGDLIKKGVEKYVKERRWRCFQLITTAYVVGRIQQSGGTIMDLLRKIILAPFLALSVSGITNFDFGKLPPRKSRNINEYVETDKSSMDSKVKYLQE